MTAELLRKVPYWNGRPEPLGFAKDQVVPGKDHDAKLDRPPRPCSRCGTMFAPTIKRRMLCQNCWTWANGQGL